MRHNVFIINPNPQPSSNSRHKPPSTRAKDTPSSTQCPDSCAHCRLLYAVIANSTVLSTKWEKIIAELANPSVGAAKAKYRRLRGKMAKGGVGAMKEKEIKPSSKRLFEEVVVWEGDG